MVYDPDFADFDILITFVCSFPPPFCRDATTFFAMVYLFNFFMNSISLQHGIEFFQFHSVWRVFPVFSRDVTGHSSHARFLVLRALKYDLNSISFSFLCHVVCVFAVMLAYYFKKPF